MARDSKQQTRFSRQIVLPQIAAKGQDKLSKSKVLVVGCGGLGGAAALYLAGCGVGTIGLMDASKIEEFHLPRQPFFSESEVGKVKAKILGQKIKATNKKVKLEVKLERLTLKNAHQIIKGYDIVVESTDNFPSRYIINDICVALKKPFVSLSIYQWDGLVSLFNPKEGPCYRCLYPQAPREGSLESSDEGGVLGTLPGVLSAIGATEVIKYLLHQGVPLSSRMLMINLLEMSFHDVKLKKNSHCPVCSKTQTAKKTSHLLAEFESLSTRDMGEMVTPFFLTPLQFKKELPKKPFIVDVRDALEAKNLPFPNSKNVPLDRLDEFLKDKKSTLSDRELIIVCNKGNKSLRALAVLNRQSIYNVKILAGGVERWMREKG